MKIKLTFISSCKMCLLLHAPLPLFIHYTTGNSLIIVKWSRNV